MALLTDWEYMGLALGWARLAARRGEVPIGAVVVAPDGEILGGGHDGKELFKDPTSHAEMMAIRRAAVRYGDWRLDGATLFVTLEPCPMCAGAILHSRIVRVVYGAANARWGIESAELNVLQNPRFNHEVEIVRGVQEEACAALLKETFRKYREARRGSGE